MYTLGKENDLAKENDSCLEVIRRLVMLLEGFSPLQSRDGPSESGRFSTWATDKFE